MISDRLAHFGTNIFTEMTLLAHKHQAINLSQGFPDFDGPDFIKLAAIDALKPAGVGANQYARMFGLPVLNQAIAAWWLQHTDRNINPDTQITVTSGCTEALAASLLGLLNPGDEVILFEPFYDSYRACIALAGAIPRIITLRPRDNNLSAGFFFDEQELRTAFTSRTKAILLNTPHNPTGKVFSRDELNLIAHLCTNHGVIAITDEVYESLTYHSDQPHLRIATFPGMEDLTLTLSSLGKTFSLTGWKIGWTIGSPDLNKAVRAAHQFLTFSSATPLQVAAAHALSHPSTPAHISDLQLLLKSNRDLLCSALDRLGVSYSKPAGAYFVMIDWLSNAQSGKSWGNAASIVADFRDDIEFCKGLTHLAGVAAIPPSAFYEHTHEARRFARLAFCKRRETMLHALDRLSKWSGIR